MYNSDALEQQAVELLQHPAAATLTISDKITYFSGLFLERPYCMGALGEGQYGHFDQGPLFRFDAFDCLTYVNTVLALSLARNVMEFKRLMLVFNYYDEQPCYLKRFHFMSLDWNRQNQQANFLRDITTLFVNGQGQPFFQTAIAQIDKGGWLRKRSVADIKLLPECAADPAELVKELHDAASQFPAQTVGMDYLPLHAFLTDDETEQTLLFQQIPDNSIIEIVRPAWDLVDVIGTKLHVSHLGFALRIDGVLMFRHATSLGKHVVQVPLRDYLQQCLKLPTIKGIAVLSINPQALDQLP